MCRCGGVRAYVETCVCASVWGVVAETRYTVTQSQHTVHTHTSESATPQQKEHTHTQLTKCMTQITHTHPHTQLTKYMTHTHTHPRLLKHEVEELERCYVYGEECADVTLTHELSQEEECHL